MEKVWLVIEYGGEYEDQWEDILYAFHTNEEARQFVKEWEAEQIKDVIDKETWMELEKDAYNKVINWYKNFTEIIYELHPEYSLESIKKSDKYYYGEFSEVYIKEVSFK